MDLLTVSQGSEILARLDRNRDVPAEYYARQIRGFLQTRILIPAGREGTGRKSALLDAERLCIALLGSVASRFGLVSEQLAAGMACTRNIHPSWGMLPGADGKGWSLAPGRLPSPVTSGIRAGGNWFFVVWSEPAEGTSGLGNINGGSRVGDPFAGDGDRSPLKRGLPTFLINVTRLFGPLLTDPSLRTGALHPCHVI